MSANPGNSGLKSKFAYLIPVFVKLKQECSPKTNKLTQSQTNPNKSQKKQIKAVLKQPIKVN